MKGNIIQLWLNSKSPICFPTDKFGNAATEKQHSNGSDIFWSSICTTYEKKQIQHSKNTKQ